MKEKIVETQLCVENQKIYIKENRAYHFRMRWGHASWGQSRHTKGLLISTT